MEYEHAIVVDKNGYKTQFVQVATVKEGGEIVKTPQYYTLEVGERLVYENIQDALGMCKPRLVGGQWVETATAEEIAAAKAEVAMPPLPASVQDLAIAELAEMVLTNQMQTDLAIAELCEMLTGGI